MQYLWLTIKHKWFVFLAGLKTGTPIWRLIIHDWSKFTLSELPHYQRQFYGKADAQEDFINAWIHHQNSNPHHWEYWIPRTGHNRCTPPYPDNQPVEMPVWAVREMVADWIGASRTYEGQWPKLGEWKWFSENFSQIRLHGHTRALVLEVVTKTLERMRSAQCGKRKEGKF